MIFVYMIIVMFCMENLVWKVTTVVRLMWLSTIFPSEMKCHRKMKRHETSFCFPQFTEHTASLYTAYFFQTLGWCNLYVLPAVYHYCSWATVFMTMCQHTMSPWQRHVRDTEWGEVMENILRHVSVFILCLCVGRMRREVNSMVAATRPCQRAPRTAGWWWRRTESSLSYLERCPENFLPSLASEKVKQTELQKMVSAGHKHAK